jgi:monothiol glutaredoxin
VSGAHPFRIAPRPSDIPRNGRPVLDTRRGDSTLERVDRLVNSAPVFLFIKGTPAEPRCGFSANLVRLIESLAVPYLTFDVLSDENIRAAAKEYVSWPTFPQLYVRGQFVGGNDIVSELAASGELRRLVRGEGDE